MVEELGDALVAGVDEGRRKERVVVGFTFTHTTHARTHACMRGEERKRKERKRGEREKKITRGGGRESDGAGGGR